MGFVFPQSQPLGPEWGFFPLLQLWLPDQATAGFLVFAHRRPANPATFVTRLWATGICQQQPTTGIPVWVSNPDADVLTACRIAMGIGPRGPITSGSQSYLPFGDGFSFGIPAGGKVQYDPDADTLSIQGVPPGFSLNTLNGSIIRGLGNSLTIPLRGPNRGQLMLSLTAGLDPQAGAADLAQHFFYTNSDGTTLTTLRYPLFDISAPGPKLSFDVFLDPAAPFDATRTRFVFQAGSPALPSGLTTPLGQQVSLTPITESGLVFQPLPSEIHDGIPTGPSGGNIGSCLTPFGKFQVTVSPPSPDGSVRLVGGLSGSEYVLSTAAPVVEFVVNQPALCPSNPLGTATAAVEPLVDAHGLATTSWISVVPASGQAASYCTNPQDSPFFNANPAPTNGWLLPFAEIAMWTGHAATPAVPMVGYGLLPAAADFADYTAMEHAVLAPARWQAVANTIMPARPVNKHAGTSGNIVSACGLVVIQQDLQWQDIVVAQTTDAQGALHQLALSSPAPILQAALQSSQVFLVATADTTTSDGVATSLFGIKGDVAIADWRFGLDFSATGEAPPILLMKFASASIQTLAGQLSSWTSANIFNSDPQSVQSALIDIINTSIANAASPNLELSEMYADIAAALTDPHWNGVLILNPTLPGLPAVVKGLASGLPTGQRLAGHHLGVSINDIGQDSAGNPVITDSAMFALVDYVPPPASAASNAHADYLFDVDYLRALFSNAQLRLFDAQVTLTINTLFGVPAVLQTDGQDAPGNAVAIRGTYQATPSSGGQSGNQGSYSFISKGPVAFRIAVEQMPIPATATIVNRAVFTKIQYAPLTGNAGQVVSRFAMWGNLSFAKPAAPAPDLFDFDSLAFANLGLIMTSDVPPQANDPRWRFDTEHAAFDLNASSLRPGLVSQLPLVLQSLRYDPSGTLTCASLGCAPVILPPTAPPQGASATFALVYSLDLSRAGAYAPLAQDLMAKIVVAWQPSGQVLVGIGIPGLGPQNQLPLQGAVPVTVGGFALAQDAANQLILQFTGCTASFLGGAIPPSPLQFNLNIVGVEDGSGLIWFTSATPAPSTSGAQRQLGVPA